jgi:hypothetical protein
MGNLLASAMPDQQLDMPEDPKRLKGLGPFRQNQSASIAPANPVPEASKNAGSGHHGVFMNLGRIR